MDEPVTLLAHLVPRLTIQVEDAATDALAFILNRSAACRRALDHVLQDDEFAPEPIARVETQVTYDDGSRPDMLGYDPDGTKRLVVEAKFWAALQPAQPRGYIEQLDAPGPGVLLFIAPASRIDTLWTEIHRRMEIDGGTKSESAKQGSQLAELPRTPDQIRRARIVDSDGRPSDKRLLLIGWTRLLESMAAAIVDDPQTASDIRQLRGLAAQQDEEAFQPIHSDEFGLTLPRRIRGLNNLIDRVIETGRTQGWITTKGARATPHRDGYGRYFRFTGADGFAFLCVQFSLWTSSRETPLWLLISDGTPVDREKLNARRPPPVDVRGSTWPSTVSDYNTGVPIHLKTAVEYDEVLDDVIRQIREVRDLVDGTGTSPEETTADGAGG